MFYLYVANQTVEKKSENFVLFHLLIIKILFELNI